MSHFQRLRRAQQRPLGRSPTMALPGTGRVVSVPSLTRAIAREIQALTAPGAPVDAPWHVAKLIVPDLTDAELEALTVADIRHLCDLAAGVQR